MKTAISVPDGLFGRVDLKAAELGVSRSEFYARAAERYLQVLEDSALTKMIDAALASSGQSARSEALEFAESSQIDAERLRVEPGDDTGW